MEGHAEIKRSVHCVCLFDVTQCSKSALCSFESDGNWIQVYELRWGGKTQREALTSSPTVKSVFYTIQFIDS